MSAKPFLSQRRIVAYNRLHSDVVAMTYVVRFNKAGGPLGVHTVRACHNMIRAANRLYRREADIPGFRQVFEDEPMTMADLSILVTRLTAAGLTFEERYAHYTKEGLLNPPNTSSPPPSTPTGSRQNTSEARTPLPRWGRDAPPTYPSYPRPQDLMRLSPHSASHAAPTQGRAE